MRNPKRIDDFCRKLKSYWKEVPDWRFGQLICNVLGTCTKDPFFYEEDEMIELFEKYFHPSEEEIKKREEEQEKFLEELENKRLSEEYGKNNE